MVAGNKNSPKIAKFATKCKNLRQKKSRFKIGLNHDMRHILLVHMPYFRAIRPSGRKTEPNRQTDTHTHTHTQKHTHIHTLEFYIYNRLAESTRYSRLQKKNGGLIKSVT